MIDFVGLLLLNMTGALFTIASFLVFGLKEEKPTRWAAPFLISGAIALACGLRMAWTWPLPGPYNIAYGEMSVLFGGLLLGAGICLAAGWNLLPMTVYAFFAGVAAVIMGVEFFLLGLSKQPLIAGAGFVVSGLGGVFAALPIAYPKQWMFRYAGAAVVVAAGLIWATTAYMEIPAHLTGFAKYLPPGMPPMR